MQGPGGGQKFWRLLALWPLRCWWLMGFALPPVQHAFLLRLDPGISQMFVWLPTGLPLPERGLQG